MNTESNQSHCHLYVSYSGHDDLRYCEETTSKLQINSHTNKWNYYFSQEMGVEFRVGFR